MRLLGAFGIAAYVLMQAATPPQGCVVDETTGCALGDRFSVQVSWKDGDHERPLTLVDSGKQPDDELRFKDPDGRNVRVSITNGCDENGYYWIHYSNSARVPLLFVATDITAEQTRGFLDPQADGSQHRITFRDAFNTCDSTTGDSASVPQPQPRLNERMSD